MQLKRLEKAKARQKADEMLEKSFEDKNNPERSKNIRAARAEETLIASFMRNPDFYYKLKDKISPQNFVTSFNRRVMECLIRILESGSEPELSEFSSEFTPEEMDSVTRIFHLSENLGNTLKECEDCIGVLTEKSAAKITDASAMSDEEFLKLFKKK